MLLVNWFKLSSRSKIWWQWSLIGGGSGTGSLSYIRGAWPVRR